MDGVIDWLMAGDPAIRWQTMRDLGEAAADEWEPERRRTLETGWVAEFLTSLRADGTWPPGRWTDTVWTLLTLMDCGIPADHPPARDAARMFVDRCLTPERAADEKWLLTRMDLCHLGFWLRIGAYFLGKDARLTLLADTVMRTQMADGGWNCRTRTAPQTRHGSFHTTFNVLEGLSAAVDSDIVAPAVFRLSEARALEFMLCHRMYRSDHSGEVVDERFTYLTFPSHWHYTVLRGLDYLRDRPEIGDERLTDPIALIQGRRNRLGRWAVEKRIPGTTLFDMERLGGESRWNTLRALRVLHGRNRAVGELARAGSTTTKNITSTGSRAAQSTAGEKRGHVEG